MVKNNSVKYCVKCNKRFDITTDDYIKYGSKYYDIDCFIEKVTTQKRNTMSLDQALQLIDDFKRENEIKRQLKLSKDMFNDYIINEYDITMINSYTWMKLADITNGVGMKEAISYDDLLFIFKNKRNYLNRINQNNMSKGKVISHHQRLNYDLAIVVSLYDNYKEWKRKQEIIEAQTKQQKEENNNRIVVDYQKMFAKTKNINDSTVEVSDILDELY